MVTQWDCITTDYVRNLEQHHPVSAKGAATPPKEGNQQKRMIAMKIESVGALSFQRRATEAKGKGSDHKRQDQLTISPQAEESRAEGLRKQEHLDSIKSKVDGGSYNIAGELVADAIIRRVALAGKS
jgi:anti-sigma28 factor (negative regulator of flagellin synthesis)